MKKTLTATALIISLYSCTPAKIATISSENVPLNNSTYVFENDTVKITYHFWADNGIMNFDIYNKMNEPIYFDWKNSAFIPNDQMVSYWQDITNTVGTASGTSSWLYGGGVMTTSRGVSKSIRQERIGVIPPHSLITKKDFKLVKSYDEMPKPGNYSKTNSFLNFRNYLMFSTNEKFEGKVMAVDNKFYVSDIKTIQYKKRESYKAQNKFVVKTVKSFHH
jgi:hypothetical protein